jgi:hypothetical protein
MSGANTWAIAIGTALACLVAWLIWRDFYSSRGSPDKDLGDRKTATPHLPSSSHDFQDTWPIAAISMTERSANSHTYHQPAHSKIGHSNKRIGGHRQTGLPRIGWTFVLGYFRRNGTYVSGYFRSAFLHIFDSYSFIRFKPKTQPPARFPLPDRARTPPELARSLQKSSPNPARTIAGEQTTVQAQSLPNEQASASQKVEEVASNPILSVTPTVPSIENQPIMQPVTTPTYWSGQTIVRGHIRKNGTYVASHIRRKSSSSLWKVPRRR